MIIFLDFDGVLRRNSDPIGELNPNILKLFESTILNISEITKTGIVISSDWRISNEFEQLKIMFPNSIADLIFGCTPYIAQPCEYERFVEITMFFEENEHLANEKWIAIDDREYYFPDHAPLLLCNPEKGFDREAAKKLIQFVGL